MIYGNVNSLELYKGIYPNLDKAIDLFNTGNWNENI